MEPTNWASEHSDALREHLARGMSYSEIARAINATFNTHYSRNATIGRARRMGLAAVDRPAEMTPPAPRDQQPSVRRLRKHYAALAQWLVPKFEPVESRKTALRRYRAAASVAARARRTAIAAIPMAATPRAKPSPFAAIRSARNPATARRIFT